MPSDTLPCRVVTPMFLAGAKGQPPELRAPSIRGGLRWWFRAVGGGFAPGHRELRRLEAGLFGDAGEHRGASPVVVRVRGGAFDRAQEEMLPHKQEVRKRSLTPCIPAGTPFEVVLQSSLYQPSAHALETVRALFDVFAALGGLGRRSRRGFGAFQPLEWDFTGATDVAGHVGEVIRAARAQVGAFVRAHTAACEQPPVPGGSRVTPFPILHPHTIHIRVGEATDWRRFVRTLMEQCHALTTTSRRVLGGGRPRQASTLLVSVVGLANGQVVPVYTQFYSNTAARPGPRPVTTPEVNRATEFRAIEALPGNLSSALTLVRV